METLTLTLHLPADLADWLREKAGADTNRFAVALLEAARDAAQYQAWKDSLTPEQKRQEQEALDRAFEAVAAGRHHPFDPEAAHKKMLAKAAPPKGNRPRNLLAFAGSVTGAGKVGSDTDPGATEDHINTLRDEWGPRSAKEGEHHAYRD